MKKDALDQLKEGLIKLKDSDNLNSYFMIGLSLAENGSLNTSLMMSKGSPFEVIGMIDVIINNLKTVKKEIVFDLSHDNKKKESDILSKSIEKSIKTLPSELQEKIRNLKIKLDKALENYDTEALDKIKEELSNLRNTNITKEETDKNDDDEFNISDFKGGLT